MARQSWYWCLYDDDNDDDFKDSYDAYDYDDDDIIDADADETQGCTAAWIL